MVKIELKKAGEIWLKVDGHAGYAEAGKDIVCSAISAVTLGFMDLCETLAAQKRIDLIRCEQQDAHLEVLLRDYGAGRMGGTYNLLENTLVLIAQEYPKYVDLTCETLPSYILFSRDVIEKSTL